MANRDYGKTSSTAVKKMADGGSVGFWERIKAGNIDAPGSEAYNRWGKGAQMDAELDSASASFKDLPTKTGSEPAAAPAATPAPVSVEQDAATSSGLRDKTPAADTKVEDLKPIETRAVNRVAPSGKSLGSGIASGYQSMAETRRLKAANTKATPNETPNETNRLASTPRASAPAKPILAPAVPGDKEKLFDASQIIKMADGGPVGSARYYGKK